MPSDTHQWAVQIEETPVLCEDYATQIECVNAGCYWYNGSCHTSLNCGIITNQSDCEANGCYWWDGSCHSSPPPEECSGYVSQAACESAGCYWYNGACYASPPQPPPEIPWMLIAGVVATAAIGIAVIALARRRPVHG